MCLKASDMVVSDVGCKSGDPDSNPRLAIPANNDLRYVKQIP